ncbi:MAG: sigma-54 dependent transcriptional regulator [Pseudomonadales bacterium]
MSQCPVAIACHDAEVAQRLLHCLEFLGLEPTLRNPQDAVAEAVVLTDAPDLSVPRDTVVVRVNAGRGALSADPQAIRIAWPPRQHDLAATLARACTQSLRSAEAAQGTDFPDLVGDSEPMCSVKNMMGQVADSDATVLITGESGTGKEVVAHSLHQASRRRGGPFVPVNCGAIPAELLESELFGHEKGAFTGALDAKKGRFELAHGGTLFLDEVGDMPLAMQVKLLRAIQDKRIERIGSVRSVPCDVRIVAATHQDLEALIGAGRFREDLYYRLAVFPITLPALRARTGDVRPIVQSLLAKLEREHSASITFSPDAWEALERYEWPGNVRELCNLVERMVVQLPDGLADVADLPLRLRSGAARLRPAAAGSAGEPASAAAPEHGVVLPVNGIDLREFLADMERSLIKQALDDTESIVARAADRLHIRRTTLVEKMRKYGIRRDAV